MRYALLAMLVGCADIVGIEQLQQAPDGDCKPYRPLRFSDAHAIVVADFGGDGRDDLALLEDHQVLILQASDAGPDLRFVQLAAYPYESDDTARLVAADFNGDGVPDLAIATATGVDVVPYIRVSGTFGDRTTLPTVAGAPTLAAADLDHDGAPDLVLATHGDDDGRTLSVWLDRTPAGATTTVFEARRDFPADPSTGAVALAIGDVDGFDGVPEVVVLDGDHRRALAYDFTGTPFDLAATDAFFAANNGRAVAVGTDGDERDLFVSGPGLVGVIAERSGSREPQVPILQDTQAGADAIAVRDVDGDGRDDVAFASAGVAYVYLHHAGFERFARVETLEGKSRQIALGNFDGVNAADVVLVGENGDVAALIATGQCR